MNYEISSELYEALYIIDNIYGFPLELIKHPKYEIDIKIAVPKNHLKHTNHNLDIIILLNAIDYVLISYNNDDVIIDGLKSKELYFRKKE